MGIARKQQAGFLAGDSPMSTINERSKTRAGFGCEQTPDLASEVKELLDNSLYYSLRTVVCGQINGQVVLQGTVANYYLKQLAQAIAVSASGSGNVRNEILVASDL